MNWIIEIIDNNNLIHLDTTGFKFNIDEIRLSRLFYLKGNLSKKEIKRSINLLFQDKVTEKHHIYKVKENHKRKTSQIKNILAKKWEIEVFYKQEVTDPGTLIIKKGLGDINIPAEDVRTGFRYVVKGRLFNNEVLLLAKKFLANLIVQDIFIKPL